MIAVWHCLSAYLTWCCDVVCHDVQHTLNISLHTPVEAGQSRRFPANIHAMKFRHTPSAPPPPPGPAFPPQDLPSPFRRLLRFRRRLFSPRRLAKTSRLFPTAALWPRPTTTTVSFRLSGCCHEVEGVNWIGLTCLPHTETKRVNFKALALTYYYHTQHSNYRTELITRSSAWIFTKKVLCTMCSSKKILLILHYLFQAKLILTACFYFKKETKYIKLLARRSAFNIFKSFLNSVFGVPVQVTKFC